jgi:hypothetical protein
MSRSLRNILAESGGIITTKILVATTLTSWDAAKSATLTIEKTLLLTRSRIFSETRLFLVPGRLLGINALSMYSAMSRDLRI